MRRRQSRKKNFIVDHDVFKDTYQFDECPDFDDPECTQDDGFFLLEDGLHFKANSEEEFRVLLAVNGISESDCEIYDIKSYE